MSRRGKVLGWTLALLLPIYWIASEIWYAASMNPVGVVTVADWFDRFGPPNSVHSLSRGGRTYYEVRGKLPPFYVIAVPSDSPSYVFAEDGRMVEWCSDPGDSPWFHEQWPFDRSSSLEVGAFREKFRR